MQKVADIKKKTKQVLEQKKLVSIEEDQQSKKTPFTPKIMEKPFPPKFKMLQLATYLRKGDPHDQIQNYE